MHPRALYLALVLWLCLPARAPALTTPATGAAACPAGVTLAAPFPCGVSYRVIGGYGGGMHVNINEPLKSNDYHALDLVRDEAGSGHDKPVTAAAAGTVKYAGWAGGGWKTYGQIVLLELDFNDGHSYQLLYAHLEQVLVSTGQHVGQRDVVGHLGRSGDNSLTYWSEAHLHFAFYRDATLNAQPYGPYGGVATVPEPMDTVQDFVTGTKATVICSAPDAGPADGAPSPDGRPLGDAGAVETMTDGPSLPPLATDQPMADSPEEGCSCAVGRRARPGLLPWLLVIAGIAARRRRRSSSRWF